MQQTNVPERVMHSVPETAFRLNISTRKGHYLSAEKKIETLQCGKGRLIPRTEILRLSRTAHSEVSGCPCHQQRRTVTPWRCIRTTTKTDHSKKLSASIRKVLPNAALMEKAATARASTASGACQRQALPTTSSANIAGVRVNEWRRCPVLLPFTGRLGLTTAPLISLEKNYLKL